VARELRAEAGMHHAQQDSLRCLLILLEHALEELLRSSPQRSPGSSHTPIRFHRDAIALAVLP
jgi:hypothetical protein